MVGADNNKRSTGVPTYNQLLYYIRTIDINSARPCVFRIRIIRLE